MRSMSLATGLLFALTSLLSAQIKVDASQIGQISGTVVNEEGQPLDGASVCTTVTSHNQGITECRTLTDKSGLFEIDHLPLITLIVSATKEEEGYSLSSQVSQEIRLTADRPTANVTIRLGPKGGMLLGTVKDKLSGKRINKINVTCIAVNGGSTYSAGGYDGKYLVNLPKAMEFIVAFSAPGYRTWLYTDPSDPSHPVMRLESGQQKVLDVELEPEAKPTSEVR
jgi:hypothetical protein